VFDINDRNNKDERVSGLNIYYIKGVNKKNIEIDELVQLKVNQKKLTNY